MNVPELPNFISLLHNRFHGAAWIDFLHQWENIIFSILASFLIVGFFIFGIRQKEMVPSGLQNFLETVEELLEKLVLSVLGEEGRKWIPFLGTIFIYILVMNLFGLVPLLKSPTASLNITVAQALCIFVIVQFLSIRNMGLWGFIYHLMGSPKDLVGWMIVPLLFPIELLTQITRPVTLAFRLFGNIFGEDILMAYAALVGVAVLPMIYPLGLPLQIPFLFMALLTSLMQALVFTLLTTVYILLSIPESEESH